MASSVSNSITDFSPVFHFILELIQNRAIVTVKCQ